MQKKSLAPAEARPAAPELSAGLRRYLYFTAATTGAAIMIVEILGAKMLSPYLGTSHFVWTAQIAVTLVALATGYYMGGRFVDRSANLSRLYGAIAAAAVYLALTIGVCETVAYQCLKMKLAVGSLLASIFLYFVPLSLLAMVGPFLVRVLTTSVSQVGGNVGRLSSVSTIGSVLGTVAIGYVLIPLAPNSITMYATALVLIGIALGYHFGWGRRGAVTVALLIALAVASVAGGTGLRLKLRQGKFTKEVFRANSNFGLLQVLESQGNSNRYYVNDYLTQNTYDTATRQSVSMFTYMLHGLARAYAPRLERVLCIGLGVGIVPMQFAREGVKTDVVEINPAVVPLAQRFFDLDPAKLNLFFGDGRQFINAAREPYDAIVLDAFLGDSNPSHLMSREAFSAMRRLLRPEGVLVINTFAGLDGEKDFFGASLYKTLTNVFASVRIHQHRVGGNTLFVAALRSDLQIVNPPDLKAVHPSCVSDVRGAFASLRETNPNHGRVLTDDFNPVEFHDAPNREIIRRNLALGMKSLQD